MTIAATCLACVEIVAFVALHRGVYFPSWSDENIHLGVAAEILRGEDLYSEVLSARPPLSIWPLVLLERLGLRPLLAARALSFASAVLTVASVGVFALRWWGKPALVAVLCTVMFVPALYTNYTYNGNELGILAATLSVLVILHGASAFVGGVLAATAVCASQHTVPIVLGVVLIVLTQRNLSRIGAFAVGALSLALVVMAGVGRSIPDMVESILLLHRYHVAATPESHTEVILILVALLESLGALGLAAIGALRGRVHRTERSLALLVLFHFLVVAFMGAPKSIYTRPVQPLILLLAARGALAVLEQMKAVIVLPLTTCLVAWPSASILLSMRDNIEYSYFPVYRSTQMAALTRPLVADEIVEFLAPRVHVGSNSIWGHATISDLVARELDLHVAGGLADFDPFWVKAGAFSAADVIARIEADGITFGVSPNWAVMSDPPFAQYWRKCFDRFEFDRRAGSGIPRLFVFVRRPDAPRPCIP